MCTASALIGKTQPRKGFLFCDGLLLPSNETTIFISVLVFYFLIYIYIKNFTDEILQKEFTKITDQ